MLLDIDQRGVAEISGLSQPTIQRMEASDGMVRCTVESLIKLIDALEAAGIEFLRDSEASLSGGRGVRLRRARAGAGLAPTASRGERPAPPAA